MLSGGRLSDVLDPLSLNLAPVPDLYEAFMKTLLKPAPRPRSTVVVPKAQHEALVDGDNAGGHGNGGKKFNHRREGGRGVQAKGKGKGRMGYGSGNEVVVTGRNEMSVTGGEGMVIDDRLLAMFAKKMKAAHKVSK